MTLALVMTYQIMFNLKSFTCHLVSLRNGQLIHAYCKSSLDQDCHDIFNEGSKNILVVGSGDKLKLQDECFSNQNPIRFLQDYNCKNLCHYHV